VRIDDDPVALASPAVRRENPRGRDDVTGGVVEISRYDEDLRTQAAVDGVFSLPPEMPDGAVDATYLVRRAAEGHRWAWERLVAKYSRLIWAMTRDFKLSESDASDVVQATWLRLLEHIDRIEHPDRVGSWLATTARHECLRHLAARKRVVLVQDDDDALVDAVSHQPEVDERLLADERAQAVREAMSSLPWRWQRLLELLMSDPPVSYLEISDQLGLPVGSIGPTRGRCLERLREILQAT
jgi:RNA polymerase sigma factor (sigma-70 family)